MSLRETLELAADAIGDRWSEVQAEVKDGAYTGRLTITQEALRSLIECAPASWRERWRECGDRP